MDESSEPNEPQNDSSSGNSLDKLKQFFTMGGDKKKWTRAIVVSVLVIGMMSFGSMAAWGMTLSAIVKSIAEPNGNYSGVNGECYMPDQYWTDPSVDLTVETVKQKVKSYKNVSSAENDVRLEKLLTYTRAQGYNPVIALAVWGKESTYTSNAQAGQDFGFAVGGGFDKQLPLAVATFDKAYKGVDPYPKKPGTPIQVNWLEIYTPSNVLANAGDKKTFFTIVQQAMPSQIVCTSNSGSSGGSPTYGPEIASQFYPPYGNDMDKITSYNNSPHAGTGHGIFGTRQLPGFSNTRDGAIDYNVKNGSNIPIYSACDGKITGRTEMHYSSYGKGAGILWLKCNDGSSGAIYAHIEFLKNLGKDVKKGQQIAIVAPHCGGGQCVTFRGSEHLHFQFYLDKQGLAKSELVKIFPKR